MITDPSTESCYRSLIGIGGLLLLLLLFLFLLTFRGCLIIGLILLFLWDLVSGITLAAHHDCSDASASYAKEDQHEDDPNEAAHKAAASNLVASGLLEALKLLLPGGTVNTGRALKKRA